MSLAELTRLAIAMGASDAAIIDSREISAEDGLAGICKEPGCENYGLSPSCPPHVSGPAAFRQLQKKLAYAMAVRLVVPSESLLSGERREIMRLLHEIVAGVEQAAITMGYTQSQAFAGGSCKKIFCPDHVDCRRLSEYGECRHPLHCRPSMSGFGINVPELQKTCGWSGNLGAQKKAADADSMSWVAGLVLIG
ncbi:MAG: DUF2284 domain-containing protein [Desulfobacteraceae bacterium]|nr:DUF2284 domain-containing protein [Desulfobacteraceae bacterium]